MQFCLHTTEDTQVFPLKSSTWPISSRVPMKGTVLSSDSGMKYPVRLRPLGSTTLGIEPPTRNFHATRENGYCFGIQVVPAWWAEQRKQMSEALSDRLRDAWLYNNSEATRQLCAQMLAQPVTHNEEITLALLPYGYIPDHVRRWDTPVNLFYPFGIMQHRWKAKLARHGWSMGDYSPQEIKHRYLCIEFEDI
jgi:hypothetical protein